MPMTTGGFANLLTKDFEKIFFDEYMRQPEEYKGLAKMSNESTHYVREGDMYGLGAMQEMHEAQAVPFERFEEGNEKTIYFTNFGLGVQFSRNMYEDDLTGHMKKGIAELGKSAAYTRDLKFWDLLNSSELPAARVGLDGLELASAIHPVEGVPGDTLSNIVDSSLSKTSLQGAIDLMEGLTNEKGIPIVMKPSVLWIPYQLKWMAKELMLSEYDPESANNAVNSLQGEGLSYKVSHYLTDANAAYLTSKDHDLRFMWRRSAEFKGNDDYNTDNAMFKGTMRFQTSFFHWRGVVKITGG